jgi:hypothetical protein
MIRIPNRPFVLLLTVFLTACGITPAGRNPAVSPTSTAQPSPSTTTPVAAASAARNDFSVRYPMRGKYWFVAEKVDGTWHIAQILLAPPQIIQEGQDIVTVAADLHAFAPWWPGQDAPKGGPKGNQGPDGVYYKPGAKFECAGALRSGTPDPKFRYSPCGTTALAKTDAGASIGRNVAAAILTFGLAAGKNTMIDEIEATKLAKDTGLQEAARKMGIDQITQYALNATRHYQVRHLIWEAKPLEDPALDETLRQRYNALLQADYQSSYASAATEGSLEQFITDYRDYDPNHLVPKATAKLAELKKKVALSLAEFKKAELVKQNEERVRKRTVGTRVCNKALGDRADMYAGWVEGSSDTKLQIRVPVYPNCGSVFAETRCFLPVGERLTWENIDGWVICEKM